ncbi:unnamed protein product [Paramecium octaurelia]|uniref:Uncharacterized protein n=1 Tax=Paramecium octaurelia TaxID=43137 RepID=A0A8S1TD36_PAROT|nr:unnamed protein product [Paramecium octaurelia]
MKVQESNVKWSQKTNLRGPSKIQYQSYFQVVKRQIKCRDGSIFKFFLNCDWQQYVRSSKECIAQSLSLQIQCT